jgi:tetratricopeptide (TPR) repeat protein
VKGLFGVTGICCAVVAAVGIEAAADQQASGTAQTRSEHPGLALERPTLAEAQGLFYNARYEAAAMLTLALRSAEIEDLASVELRTSALLFQLKALLEDRGDADQALKNCATCPDLIADFFADVRRGQNLAHRALLSNPDDEMALFFLGKLDLNYVWLQLGPLRRKTGWNEYWEARRSLDGVLKVNPRNVRARVARAWIDYIVDTRMPWGTHWLLGGGNRKQALSDMREAAAIQSDFFTHAEAEFGLWDMQVRERDMVQATTSARRLAHDFPENAEVAAFLEARLAGSRR